MSLPDTVFSDSKKMRCSFRKDHRCIGAALESAVGAKSLLHPIKNRFSSSGRSGIF